MKMPTTKLYRALSRIASICRIWIGRFSVHLTPLISSLFANCAHCCCCSCCSSGSSHSNAGIRTNKSWNPMPLIEAEVEVSAVETVANSLYHLWLFGAFYAIKYFSLLLFCWISHIILTCNIHRFGKPVFSSTLHWFICCWRLTQINQPDQAKDFSNSIWLIKRNNCRFDFHLTESQWITWMETSYSIRQLTTRW